MALRIGELGIRRQRKSSEHCDSLEESQSRELNLWVVKQSAGPTCSFGPLERVA